MIPTRVLRLFDIVVVVIAMLQVLQTGAARELGWVASVGGVGSGIAFLAGWLVWRRLGARWGLVVLCSAGFAGLMVLGGSGIAILSVLVGVSLVTLGFGPRWGSGAVVLFVALLAVTIPPGAEQRAMVADLVGAFVVLMIGVAIGQVLRELAAERRRNADLLDEVRRAAVTEQELMLADERSRSARELHDGLGHQLTLVVLSLEFAERMRAKAPERAFAEVGTARETAAEALGHMRRWVRALNPPREDAVTGNAAFEAIARSFRGTGLEVNVTHHGQERELDRASSLFALRMVQEGLTNVVRHSSATSVDLLVDWQPHALRLVLSDDGGAAPDLNPGFGLRSLAERARALGGSFEARSTEHGVEISGTIPTQEEK